jgi:hypothetical protein
MQHTINALSEAMNFKNVFLLVLALNINAATGQNDETEVDLQSMIPANLFASETPLHDQIKYPENSDNRTVFIKCETDITRSGNFQNVVCYLLEGLDNENFQSAILAGARQANATPAVIDGEKVEVWLPFSVIFAVNEQGNTITVLPNHLLYLNQYGTNYSAPQRYYGPLLPTDRIGSSSNCDLITEDPARIIQKIGKDGLGTETMLPGGNEIPCRIRLDRMLSRFKYIPARSNGEFVEGAVDMFDVFYSSGWGR